MIKIYGLHTCPYCDYVYEQVKDRTDEFEYIDIGTHVRYLGEFMRMRDNDPVFDHLKAIGDIGIPAFVLEDGRISTDPADAGLIEYGSAAACSLEDHRSGRKGC
ncbi:MAG: glutaredoxin-related protein [Firmicutes bacterium]|nr:glutaredoxin-related protein [Bacillota bacterium]